MKLLFLFLFSVVCSGSSATHIIALKNVASYSKFLHQGPNCYSSTLFAGGFFGSMPHISSRTLEMVLNSGACTRISPESRRRGDLIVIKGVDYQKTNYFGHSALVTNKNHAISKMGHLSSTSVEQSSIKENPGIFIREKECKKSLVRSGLDQKCFKKSSTAIYYRCSFYKEKQRLQAIELATEIWVLVEKLGLLALSNDKPDKPELSKVRAQINWVEFHLIQHLKEFFPFLNLYETEKKSTLSQLSFGSRGRYPIAELNKFIPEAQDTMLIVSIFLDLKLQLSYL